ncbi:hypothetical protein BV898_07070 [Hypsibius exemplaris]|uniref:Dehydrogenase/reductase SDR family member 11 n=1 Tax=Hypsibius exemplaris TaxID=2072580 RepID=A0A1W0WUI3_HYPEX|nr:hypothetical protein BV898_07070 [Hypsibius exemplaris]
MIDLNVLGLSICAREALRLMGKQRITDGHIVNINSFAGHPIPRHDALLLRHEAHSRRLDKALNAELRQKAFILVTARQLHPFSL